jgi:UDP-glucose 4-epimerase
VRYLITGGSGYIGTKLVDRLSRREDTERVVICDVAQPRGGYVPKTEFKRMDVRDRQGVRSTIEAARPDVVVHLAFILNPTHDEAFMYEVDVTGTQNVLDAAGAAGVGQVLVTTSAVAYGAFPDNPVPLTEDDPVRGVARFSYARDKTESDRICQLWAADHPDRVMTIVRPCIVFGPTVDNYLVRIWTKMPFTPDVGRLDQPFQFVHVDDVADAVTGLLLGRHAGAYNLAGDGVMTARECGELIGRRVRRMPLRAYRGLAALMWGLRASEVPPGQVDFGIYPWIVSNDKVKRTLGWTPAHTSRETFEIAMRAHGEMPPAAPAEAPQAGARVAA